MVGVSLSSDTTKAQKQRLPSLCNGCLQPLAQGPRVSRGCKGLISLTRSSFPLDVTSSRDVRFRLFWYRSVRPGHYQPHQCIKRYRIGENELLQSASIWSPVVAFEPTSAPSQDRQSAGPGPRLTGSGAGGAVRCEPSLRSASETSGTWCPRRMLKRESRRKHFTGD